MGWVEQRPHIERAVENVCESGVVHCPSAYFPLLTTCCPSVPVRDPEEVKEMAIKKNLYRSVSVHNG